MTDSPMRIYTDSRLSSEVNDLSSRFVIPFLLQRIVLVRILVRERRVTLVSISIFRFRILFCLLLFSVHLTVSSRLRRVPSPVRSRPETASVSSSSCAAASPKPAFTATRRRSSASERKPPLNLTWGRGTRGTWGLKGEGEEDGARRDVAEELLLLSRSRPRPP